MQVSVQKGVQEVVQIDVFFILLAHNHFIKVIHTLSLCSIKRDNMTNKIEARFFTLNFSAIPDEIFESKCGELIESLRSLFPIYNRQQLNRIEFKFDDLEAHAPIKHSASQLCMLDANLIFGIKLSANELCLTVDKYQGFTEALGLFSTTLGKINEILKISHFQSVSMRNINVFDLKTEVVDSVRIESFDGIRNQKIWGSQPLDVLDDNFLCSGSTTRHEYINLQSGLKINISSGVGQPNQSYIPQADFDIWQMRGNIPIKDAHFLVVDINGIYNQIKPGSSGTNENRPTPLAVFSLEVIQSQFSACHELINQIYDEISI